MANSTLSRNIGRIKKLRVNTIFIILIVCILTMLSVSDKFFTLDNIMNLIRQVTLVGIMATAVTPLMISGNLDLSIGSIFSFAALVACEFSYYGVAVAVLLAIAVGAICGLVNGLLIGYLKLNALIVTLATMLVFQALAFWYRSGDFLVADKENLAFQFIGQGDIFGIPTQVVIFICLIIIFHIILNKTVFGHQIKYLGSNKDSALYTGISFTKVTIILYVMVGIAAGISGIVISSRLMAAQPKLGIGYEFEVITAVVLGGVSLLGGKGSMLGTFFGVLILGILKNGFVLAGLQAELQDIAQGIILILAVALDTFYESRGRAQ